MRFSIAAASLAVSVALLAGCSSSSQGVSALPGGGASSSQPMGGHGHGPFQPQVIHGKMDLVRALKMQIAGKLPAPARAHALQAILKTIQGHNRPNFGHHPGGAVGAWVLNEPNSYLLGLKANLKKSVTAVNLFSNGCEEPTTVKVDSAKNAYVACVFNTAFDGATVQEYGSTGTLENNYNWTAPACPPSTFCEEQFGEGFDSGASSTNVYAANTETVTY